MTRGFTLLEVMLVMAIVTILMLACLPRLSSNHDAMQLRESAKTALETLRYAHDQSLVLKRPVRCSYDAQGHRWYLEVAEDVVGTSFVPIRRSWEGFLELPETVHMARFVSRTPHGDRSVGHAMFFPYGDLPSVEIILSGHGNELTITYAGRTRQGVIRAGSTT